MSQVVGDLVELRKRHRSRSLEYFRFVFHSLWQAPKYSSEHHPTQHQQDFLFNRLCLNDDVSPCVCRDDFVSPYRTAGARHTASDAVYQMYKAKSTPKMHLAEHLVEPVEEEVRAANGLL